ncbi:class F sortase [Nocardioides jejuensis]|uniref:Class F sortase n=1 Tax=Nocardioides jejuensis TaxID=2502782 RepID=A0A4R1BYL0_9ACTN|nr:class F sortase [Nocardioides jejuensis]TCJ23180.1 class F sortase [Nocardioides jejuensis]
MTTNQPVRTDTPPPHPSGAIGLGVLAIMMWGLIGLVAGGAWLASGTDHQRGGSPRAIAPTSHPTATVQLVSGERPERLRIPSIDVDTRLMNLGLTATRELEVPPYSKAQVAGWYDRSPVPGEVGPSILAGHVDTKTGPAVFYRLRDLHEGDRVAIDRTDGRTASFEVDRVDLVTKSAFPTKRVYGATADPELRLITCGGTFDDDTGHYLSNVVVYAHLVRLSPS